MAKLKHRVQVAEEERDLAVEKERETKLRVYYIEIYPRFLRKENVKIIAKHCITKDISYL